MVGYALAVGAELGSSAGIAWAFRNCCNKMSSRTETGSFSRSSRDLFVCVIFFCFYRSSMYFSDIYVFCCR